MINLIKTKNLIEELEKNRESCEKMGKTERVENLNKSIISIKVLIADQLLNSDIDLQKVEDVIKESKHEYRNKIQEEVR